MKKRMISEKPNSKGEKTGLELQLDRQEAQVCLQTEPGRPETASTPGARVSLDDKPNSISPLTKPPPPPAELLSFFLLFSTLSNSPSSSPVFAFPTLALFALDLEASLAHIQL